MKESLTPRQQEYWQYLKSDKWKRKRRRALARDHHKCVVCGSKEKLQVHHKGYAPVFGDEALHSLATLCRRCHRFVHFGEVPNIKELIRRCGRKTDILMELEANEVRAQVCSMRDKWEKHMIKVWREQRRAKYIERDLDEEFAGIIGREPTGALVKKKPDPYPR